jgi:hypothetical protein
VLKERKFETKQLLDCLLPGSNDKENMLFNLFTESEKIHNDNPEEKTQSGLDSTGGG